MATPSSRRFTYDVFLSFRGEDTRYDFTGNLYKSLCDRGIHTFIDNEELQSGEKITAALVKAIEESRIAIVVLSHNYASSSFCLDELAAILDCKNKGLLVIPVFYKVDPSYVRHQKGSYGEALTKRQRRFEDTQKVQKWEAALRQVANLSGDHFKEGDEYQYEFIGRIIERVSREINRAPLHVADYPVGLLSQVLEVKELLDVGSDDVHMIGIHGMGGLGKTTLSVAVYNLIADDFDSSCFLQNVREESKKHGLKHLQTILLSKILGEKDINLASEHEGISMIQQRLQRKKVLLILDDVDKWKQLQALAGRSDWFGPGSRIIITTRDQQLLKSHEIERTYEVEKLNRNDSLQLLKWKAFKKEQVDPSYVEVLDDVVTYASGLPLALEVIGSNLLAKSVEEWKSAINQYKRIPSNQILEILKVSFEDLESEEKSVFLDIACCFKGYILREVEDILGAIYDDCMKHHISVLVDKSLIKVKNDWWSKVEIHDLIEEMGRQIDRQESPEGSGKRRRILLPKDLIQVLKGNTGTSIIEILSLDISIYMGKETLDWNAFGNMKNLKVLIIRNFGISGGPNCFPESLRVLKWDGYPSNCFPSNFDPNKLLICKLAFGRFTSFKFPDSSKKFENLTELNFDDCNLLEQIPDVSDLPNLEKLSFQWCGSLVSVHNSVGFLTKLKILIAERCEKLRRFPPLNLTSLETLELSHCLSLENFPEILGKMGNIRKLSLRRLPIKELPDSFQNLTGLQELELNCDFIQLSGNVLTPELTSLCVVTFKEWKWVKSKEGEEDVGSTVSSNVQSFWGSYNLDDDFFSAVFPQLAQVKQLWLVRSNVSFLPECMKEFHHLNDLGVSFCKYLKEIRGIPPNLRKFRAVECRSLTSSSSSILLNKQLHEAGKTDFIFQGGSIPSWFDKQSRGPSISFWFRNKFPAKVVSLVILALQRPQFAETVRPMVLINGEYRGSYDYSYYLKREEGIVELDHVYLFDLRVTPFRDDLTEMPLEEEWKHVEVTYEGMYDTSLIKAMGIHVVKTERTSMEDIRYDIPF